MPRSKGPSGFGKKDQTNGFNAAIIENSNELRRFQHTLQQLQHEISKLTERFEEHQKAHAT